MAGLLTVLVIGATDGIGKYRTKRKAKKAAKEELVQNQEREAYFQTSKAREAAQDRERADAEYAANGEQGSSSMHPALRGGPVEAPPPYIKDAPSYDEHQSHPQADDAAAREDVPAEEDVRPGESEGARRRRNRNEYFRLSGQSDLMSAGAPT